jgi:hypothetical protein
MCEVSPKRRRHLTHCTAITTHIALLYYCCVDVQGAAKETAVSGSAVHVLEKIVGITKIPA